MVETRAGSVLKDSLTAICRTNRWSYGVFWSFHQINSMLMTMDDICYEEDVKMVANDMLQQVHQLGEGVIGMAALTGQHRWIFSDVEWSSSMFLGSHDRFQDNSEFHPQFSCGIKTVAVIPVHPHGVMQLGSTHKIFESSEFLMDTKRLLSQVIVGGGHEPLETTSMVSCSDVGHFDDLKLTSGNSDDWSLNAVHNDSRRDFTQKSCASMDSDLVHFSKSSCEPSVLMSSEPVPAFDIRDQDAEFPSYLDSLSSLPNPHKECLFEDFVMDLPEISLVDDLFQWFDSSPEHGTDTATLPFDENVSQSIRVSTASSDLVEADKFADDQNKSPVVSSQSSVTRTSHSHGLDNTVMVQNAATNSELLFNGFNFGCGRSQENVITEARGSYFGGQNGMSAAAASTSKLVGDGSSDLPRKRLFWELGIEELLDGLSNSSSVTKSGIENQLSSYKRTKMERLSLDSFQDWLGGPCSSVNPRLHSSMAAKADHFLCKKEGILKPQASCWTDDSYSTNIGGSVVEKSQQSEEPAKVSKKRARSGESNRPRPKDRQQIQDRIKELRGIIPNGAKCSIDSLLDRTIKYMLFLQSVAKYADKLKQSNKPKLIDQEKGVAFVDKCTTEQGSGGGGITWAFKVGATPTVCPVIVEDLGSPGQMLVEMLCDERGFFLEIADMIRSCGLTILKGLMEIRGDKIWAQFVVEVKLNTNQSVTRINVFLSLMELLQQTNVGGVELGNQSGNGVDCGSGIPVPPVDCLQIPISFVETFQ